MLHSVYNWRHNVMLAAVVSSRGQPGKCLIATRSYVSIPTHTSLSILYGYF